MKHRVVAKPALQVVGVPLRTSNSRGDMPAALQETWPGVWRSDLPRSFGVDFDLHRGSNAVDVHVALRG